MFSRLVFFAREVCDAKNRGLRFLQLTGFAINKSLKQQKIGNTVIFRTYDILPLLVKSSSLIIDFLSNTFLSKLMTQSVI